MLNHQPPPSAHTDRNLLFGALALQSDLITDKQFIEACGAWAARKDASLADLLIERGWLTKEARAHVEFLLACKLKKHGGDVRASLGEVATADARDLIRGVENPEIRKTLSTLSPAAGYVFAETLNYSPTTQEGTRYTLTRLHAEGGLGRIYVALDNDLRREVALKEIKPEQSGQPEAWQRFLKEAQITGQLEHPNIVPVYELARRPLDGQPFYTMRLVRGQTLGAAIAAFHARRKEGTEDPLELRQLLGAFVDVCQAIGYAHSRGVIHRDLKPENILLGSFGEVIVVDWGLAKMVDESQENDTRPIAVSAEASADATMLGRILGTPAYMAPEQADGRLDLIDARTDIYCLGGILFEILTGHAPHSGTDTVELLQHIVNSETPRVRSRLAHVPAALDAICARAMAKTRSERYTRAVDLANDIQRFLADEPVTAYRERWPQRLGRWVRRHQTLAAGTGALLTTAVIALAVSTLLVGRALHREEKARTERALAQVDQLRTAKYLEVPSILKYLESVHGEVLPRLRELWAEQGDESHRLQRMRIGMALLPVDTEAVKKPVYDWMMETPDAREMIITRDALQPYRAEFTEGLWKTSEDAQTRPTVRFRALVALAAYDAENPRWKTAGKLVVEQFLGEQNPLFMGVWTLALQPVRDSLMSPLREVFTGRKMADKRQVAAAVLELYTRDRPAQRVELALEADGQQYAILLHQVLEQRAIVLPLLHAELSRQTPARATAAELDVLAFRKANAAITLLHFGLPEPVWPLLRHTEDPSIRTYITQHLRSYGVPVQTVADRLNSKLEVSERRALLLALGEYPPDALQDRQPLLERLKHDYIEDPDPGIHSATGWLMRQWKWDRERDSLREKLCGEPAGSKQWYVNKQGQSFAIIPRDQTFQMGSPEEELDRYPNERQHLKRIPRSYAIAIRQVTVAQFRRFLTSSPAWKHLDNPELASFLKKNSPEDDAPMIMIDWFMAAAYCNWLSKEEGIPESQWCYPEKVGEGMKLPSDFLERTGYRLPTEAEWEYACRAGATTSRFYGRSPALLGKYSWYSKNTDSERTQPGGLLRPNDLGLFDVYGNVWEWCQDRFGDYPSMTGEAVEDRFQADTDITATTNRVVRGGAFLYSTRDMRSAYRYSNRASTRIRTLGLRPARTYRD